ncbi:MAG: energy transducer TonB [Chlorobium limicola]|nr:energy transducer TonB [Chlorobium limicola]
MTRSGMLWASLGASFLLHIVLMVFVNAAKPDMVRVEAATPVMTFAISEQAPTPLPSVQKPEPQPEKPSKKQVQKSLQPVRKTKQQENPVVRQISESHLPAPLPVQPVAEEKQVAAVPEPSNPTGSPDRMSKYLSKVRNRIASKKYYPTIATRQNMYGTVRMRIQIDAQGNIGRPAVVRSSGYPAIDDAAVNAALKAAPFEPPGKYGLSPMTVEIPVIYKLQ